MRTFRYPPDVIEELRAAWNTTGWREPDPEPLPRYDVLQAILEVAYHASFTTEERRATKLSMALCEPEETQGALRFELEREFSVHEIMRLAPAGDVDDDPIAIRVGANGQIKIWGFASGRSWAHPTFTVPSPGTIEVRRFSRVVFALAAGRMLPPEVVSVHFVNSMFEKVASSLVEDFISRRGPMGNAYNPYQLFGETLVCVLREAAAHGHGATVFVVPDADATSGILRGLLRTKYACMDAGSLWPTLRRSAHAVVNGLSMPLEGQAPEEPISELESMRLQRELAEWPRRMARLSRVDGGVLLTDHYLLLGFGVEVVAAAPGLRTVRTPDGSEEDIERYGTLHRSAFRLCSQYPEAVAFVCSQDGGIKCVRSRDGLVTLWK